MEEIKYPTGKFEIDWLLEKPNRALETNSLSEAIKYLIEKHNELVRAMADTTHENNGLHKHIVTNLLKPDVMIQDFINELSVKNLLTLNEMIIDSLKSKSSDEKFNEAQKLQEQLKNVRSNNDYDALQQRLKVLNAVSGFNCL